MLCFVDGEWPLISPPTSYRGVSLESMKSIKKSVGQRERLDAESIDRLCQILAAAFPPK